MSIITKIPGAGHIIQLKKETRLMGVILQNTSTISLRNMQIFSTFISRIIQKEKLELIMDKVFIDDIFINKYLRIKYKTWNLPKERKV